MLYFLISCLLGILEIIWFGCITNLLHWVWLVIIFLNTLWVVHRWCNRDVYSDFFVLFLFWIFRVFRGFFLYDISFKHLSRIVFIWLSCGFLLRFLFSSFVFAFVLFLFLTMFLYLVSCFLIQLLLCSVFLFFWLFSIFFIIYVSNKCVYTFHCKIFLKLIYVVSFLYNSH